MELSQFYEKLDVCKKDSESTIFIYDTSALMDIYCRYGKKFFSEKLLKEGMHIIPGKVIEELTNCDICVYGKTIGIIGPIEEVANARKSIEMLLEGAMHASVYKFLEKQRRDTKMMGIKDQLPK